MNDSDNQKHQQPWSRLIEFNRRYWPWILILAVIVVIFKTYYERQLEAKLAEEKRLAERQAAIAEYIPPRALNDGSISYTLINNRVSRDLPHSFEHWVLNFQDAVNCFEPGENGNCSKYEPARKLPTISNGFEGLPNNSSIQLIFNLNTNSLLKPDEAFTRVSENENYVELTFYAFEVKPKDVEVTEIADRPGYKKSSYLSEVSLCRLEQEVSRNLFQLRNLTEVEEVVYYERKPNPMGYRFYCFAEAGQSQRASLVEPGRSTVTPVTGSPPLTNHYVFFEDNLSVARGYCYIEKKTRKEKFCSFALLADQNRMVHMTFSPKFLQGFAGLQKQIDQLINELTDEENSTNLGWVVENE